MPKFVFRCANGHADTVVLGFNPGAIGDRVTRKTLQGSFAAIEGEVPASAKLHCNVCGDDQIVDVSPQLVPPVGTPKF